MLFFLITCFSLVLYYKSLFLKPLEPWACEMRLLSPWFWKDLSFVAIAKSINRGLNSGSFALSSTRMSVKKKTINSSRVENVELNCDMSVLDLPELVLECILERLPPDGLCRMAAVCSSLRDRCMSDHLWDRHMKQKWGRIIGPAAYREWQLHIASDLSFLEPGKGRGLMGYLSLLWPLSLVRSNTNRDSRRSLVPVDSIMSFYLALEKGKFWFPAQVYNRENGHAGFMLSCYDAELSYDSRSDTFQARYPPHGRRAVALEMGVTWDRLRAPPMDTSPHYLHISGCLNDLCPGDHIEIQWRRNKEFPYEGCFKETSHKNECRVEDDFSTCYINSFGWWYGVVGHLEPCDGNDSYCCCRESETVVLEFNQYTPGSRWRCSTVNRKDHREEGNETDGFYGGIRKLHHNDEISTWKRLWPTNVLE